MLQPQFVLKTTPPRLPRAAVLRRALINRWDDLRERTAILVTAPRGFGKTTLLSQWRRAWLERGAFVAWLTLDAQDTPGRFVEVLLAALHAATGRANLQVSVAESGTSESGREKEALTALLAAVADLATPTVLVLDDADRLPPETLNDGVSYLMFNAPPNLRMIIGARGQLPLDAAELVGRGDLAQVGIDELRLALDDTSRSCSASSATASRSTTVCACTKSPRDGRSDCRWPPRRSSARQSSGPRSRN